MTADQITYLVFFIVVSIALVFDLGFLSKKNKTISTQTALKQTIFWVILAFAFFIFVWYEEGKIIAIEYISAYLMEWSLSIDNIFVFIIIFSAFKVDPKYYGRVLLIGILMAIVFRIIFITIGIALVQQAQWTLYIFGVFLIYTGYKMFASTQESEFNPQQSKVYKWMLKYLPITLEDGGGKFLIRNNGKPLYTSLFVVVVMLAITDLVFALDSIPAVMGISRNNLVIYTSNIFAVLGLRSLFFLLRGAVAKFEFLQQGIAIILVFIGLKMLLEHYLEQWITKNQLIVVSLLMIVVCIIGSILYSIQNTKKKESRNKTV
ncbi:MAG: TerC/Alx family metal homeostasis membrane protein [Chitinophagaceae bacterium]|nr:TerC/Alx family metal homeostasis membrane protein [Chitinophagaceae bacterium]